jgi:hypothetical protein
MSAATDALREALEALATAANDIDTADVESELDDWRGHLDAIRTDMRDAATVIREAMAKVQQVAASVRALFDGEDDGEVIPESRITALLDELGGLDSSDYGPLDDLDREVDVLESVIEAVTSALGDEQEQAAQLVGGAT